MIADVLQARFTSKSVVEVHGTAAGDQEHMLNPVIRYRFEYIIGNSQHHSITIG
jgi:hypothetical protein